MLEERHHRHGQPPHDGGDRSFPRVRGLLARDAQPLELEVRHLRVVLQDDLCALRKQVAQHGRSGLRYGELLVDVARLVLPWHEPEIWADITSLGEPPVVPSEECDVSDRAEEPDAEDLPDALDVRLELVRFRKLVHLLFKRLDLHCDGLEDVHKGPAEAFEFLRPRASVKMVKVSGNTLRDAESDGLGESPHFVDELRAGPDQHASRLEQADHLLVGLGAQEHGMKNFHIGQRVAREFPRVVRVVLRVRLGELLELGGIRHVDREAQAPEVARHPPAVDARLERHRPGATLVREILRESLLRRRDRRLLDDPAGSPDFRHDADFRSSVAHVDPDCGIILHVSSFLICVFAFAPPQGRVRIQIEL